MQLATNPRDLERKTEDALANRFRQHPALKGLRMRRTSEDSAKVNQDLVLTAKRGEGNPPFSGVFNMEVKITYTMKHRKSVDTLSSFLATCAALEEVLSVETYTLAGQLSLCTGDFHCYEVAVTDKDDTPEEKKHRCVWTLSAIAMPISYAVAANLQSKTQPPN